MRYTSRGVSVEAIQWTGENDDEVNQWMIYFAGPTAGFTARMRLNFDGYYRNVWFLRMDDGILSMSDPVFRAFFGVAHKESTLPAEVHDVVY